MLKFKLTTKDHFTNRSEPPITAGTAGSARNNHHVSKEPVLSPKLLNLTFQVKNNMRKDVKAIFYQISL